LVESIFVARTSTVSIKMRLQLIEMRKPMRLVITSDTHGCHNSIPVLPDGDFFVHAGDFMNSGVYPQEIVSFNMWLGEQRIKYRVVCCGNHDRLFQNSPESARHFLTNATYLENSGVTIDGVSFWGSPYTPEFMNWAFMYRRRPEANQYWDQMPEGLDVLITHGPPCGILDQATPDGEHLGCVELLKAVQAKKPKVHIFDYIHGGAGMFENGDTRFINAAYLSEQYQPTAPAGIIRVVDL
jgi:Icc-related predicted phosphoesterase